MFSVASPQCLARVGGALCSPLPTFSLGIIAQLPSLPRDLCACCAEVAGTLPAPPAV